MNRGRIASGAPEVELVPFSSIPMVAIHWLWPRFLARGKLHVLAGAPGTGKTTLSMAIAATISCGGDWPDGSQSQQGKVLIWSGEDDPSDTLKPRLVAQGARVEDCFFVGDVSTGDQPRCFDPAIDMPLLKTAAVRAGGITLIIVDPISSALTGQSHANAEVRRALQPFVDLAQEIGAAVLGITHLSKNSAGREPLERVTGSVAFGALPRIVLFAARRRNQDGEENGRVLLLIKSNIGSDGGGISYEVEPHDVEGIETTRVSWGNAVEGSAQEILGGSDQPPIEENSRQHWIRQWLTQALSNGELLVTEIAAKAAEAGIGKKALENAKKALGVGSRKIGKEGGWAWVPKPEDP